jgi:hypothetical protein
MATIAVFVALGGVSYAALKLPKNSVGTKQLKPNAVSGSKVADGSLSAADFGGPVDSATSAARADHAVNSDHAINSDHAANSDLLDGLDSAAFQRLPKVRTEDPTVTNDYTPDVSGLDVLVLHNTNATVMGGIPPEPSFTGGVEGQRLTIVGTGNEVVIFTDQNDLQLASSSWAGEKGDTLSLVLANGVWYETGRSKNH